ncbi:MAG: chromosome partitioning protein ParB [Bacteroidetes bacterium GWF2_38_335]|nr:MAG: chromosome partitioning protein ParB [Bacteroidetes bacterium GWF2_38_335]OFY80712.1 MAG: chromosome partitioning protein ParB [Bacteroidetes bacterium RIFOXYA12_FULL_38_20]HBS87061.1 chromosome partitioning protein ParB [Bacteroidales bacterium]
MAKKQALGRGLGALIEQDVKEERVGSINEIEISKIDANPYQPRKNFDEESLQELADSIKVLGIIQPITVRATENDRYQLITGERRFRASKLAGLEKIPAYVRGADNQGMLEMALVENIQREDLDAIEVALSYQRLIEECNLTQENMSDRVGKKRSTISNYLRLLKLPAEIQLGIRNKKITMGHARAVVNIEDPETQLMIYQQILKYDFSVRKVEEVVRELSEVKEEKEEKTAKSKISHPEEYEKLEEHLSTYFESKVEFKKGSRGAGKIIIPFKNDDDLERIIGIIDKINN